MTFGKTTEGIEVELGLNADKFTSSVTNAHVHARKLFGVIGESEEKLRASWPAAARQMETATVSAFEQVHQGVTVARAAVSAFLANEAVQFVRRLAEIGLEAEATGQRLRLAFGGNVERVKHQLEDVGDAAGFAVSAMESQAAGLRHVLGDLGVPAEMADEMSVRLTQLAADIAAVNRVPLDVAGNAFRSALGGSARGLMQLNVTMRDSDVSAKMMDLGFDRVAEGATTAQRAYAAYQVVLDKTKDFVGAATRDQETLAGQLRRTGSEYENLKETVGSSFDEVASQYLSKGKAFLQFERDIGSAIASLWSSPSIPDAHVDAPGGASRAVGQQTSDAEKLKQTAEALNLSRLKSSTLFHEHEIADEKAFTEILQKELAKQEGAYTEHFNKLTDLEKQRKAARETTEENVFRTGFDAMKNPDAQANALRARITQSYNAARDLDRGGDIPGAREALTKAGALITELHTLLGDKADVRSFQDAWRALGAEMDRLFEKQIAQEKQLQDGATSAIEALKSEMEGLKTTTAQEIALLDQLRAAFADLRAAQGAGGPSGASTQGITAEAHATGGRAGGGQTGPAPSDSVLAWLTRGEAVLSPYQTKMHEKELRAWGIPGFAGGGSPWQDMLAGTRRYTHFADEAARADSNQATTAAGLSGIAALNARTRMGGAGSAFNLNSFNYHPPTGQESLAARLGFGGGGRVGGGPTTVNVGDVNIDYRSEGGTQRDAVALAREVRRAVRRGFVNLDTD